MHCPDVSDQVGDLEMIDWKRQAVRLARAVEKNDLGKARKLALGMLSLTSLEASHHELYLDWFNCQNNKESEIKFEQYLESVRLANDLARRLVDG